MCEHNKENWCFKLEAYLLFLCSPENLYSHALNAHERSHIRAEERLKTLRWPWENEKTLKDDPSVDDKEDNDFYDEVMFSDRQLQRKFRYLVLIVTVLFQLLVCRFDAIDLILHGKKSCCCISLNIFMGQLLLTIWLHS